MRTLGGWLAFAWRFEVALYRSLVRWATRRPAVPAGATAVPYVGAVSLLLWVFTIGSAAGRRRPLGRGGASDQPGAQHGGVPHVQYDDGVLSDPLVGDGGEVFADDPRDVVLRGNREVSARSGGSR